MPVLTVSEVNRSIQQMFSANRQFWQVSVSGEVGECKADARGNLYFPLKEGDVAKISCIMYSSDRVGLNFPLESGMQVVVHGRIGVYEKSGTYSLYARRIEQQQGMGSQHEQLEQLRRRLAAEGLFAAERKKKIPKYVRTVGIVTSPTGKAIGDIVQTAARRNPYVQLILSPSLVQGERAPESIVAALRRMDAMHPDVIIIGRGGGAADELTAFNAEAVVRAVAACETPIISSVGHEYDDALTDFAADLRASTPTAAAELAIFEYDQFAADLAGYHTNLYHGLKRKIDRAKSRSVAINERLLRVGPEKALLKKKNRIVIYKKDMERSLSNKLDYAKKRSMRMRERFIRVNPEEKLKEKKNALVLYRTKLNKKMEDKLLQRKHRMELLAGRLDERSPAKRLSGGYAFVSDERNVPISSVEQVSVPMKLKISLRDGVVFANAEKTEKGKKAD